MKERRREGRTLMSLLAREALRSLRIVYGVYLIPYGNLIICERNTVRYVFALIRSNTKAISQQSNGTYAEMSSPVELHALAWLEKSEALSGHRVALKQAEIMGRTSSTYLEFEGRGL
jgi:hypothetical protein